MSLPAASLELRNLRAIAAFVSYITTCVILASILCRDIYTAKKKTSSQSPRWKFRVMTLLTCLSLAVTWFYMIGFFRLSYRAWYLDKIGSVTSRETSLLSLLRLGQWLRDVQLFRDAWEIATETHARLFWSQPIFFLTAAWSLFLAQAGRTYRIRRLSMYMLLGQIVAISFAANLFFLSVLSAKSERRGDSSVSVTQAPLPRRVRPSSNVAHRLWEVLQVVPALMTVVSVALLPYVANTGYFLPVLAIPHLALFLPLLNTSRGDNPRSGIAADSQLSYHNLYWMIIILGSAAQLHTLRSVAIGGGQSHLHRHSKAFNVQHESVYNSTASHVLAALFDHPAVSSVGWDTLLCLLSFAVWNAVNGTSKSQVLKATHHKTQ